jgi:RNA polymerase sigma-70 factor (ECF subfamily)
MNGKAPPATVDAVMQGLVGLGGAAYQLAVRIVGYDLAEDAVQQAYLDAFRHVSHSGAPWEQRTWFLRVVANAAKKQRRKNASLKRRERARRPDDATPPPSPGLLDGLRAAMDALDEKYRVPIALCYEQDLTQREAAEILDVPARTLSKHISVGLKRLQKALGAAGISASAAVVLGGLKQTAPVVPASLVARIEAAVAAPAASAGSAAPAALSAAAGAKGGGMSMALAGIVLAGTVAAGVAVSLPERGGGEKAAAAAAPAPSRRGDWRKERWVVEEFTDVMGGGPGWGNARGVGVGVKSMVQGKDGSFYVVRGQQVDIITPEGIRYPLAGTGGRGYRDGPAERARFKMGVGAYYGFSNIGVDDRGNVFVPDNGNNRIRRIFKDDAGTWRVETYAGGGKKKLEKGESCPPRQARISGNLHVAVAPDGTVTVGGASCVWRIPADGKVVTCLGGWPKAIDRRGKGPRMNICGAGADRHGDAYFAGRTVDVVCRVDKDGAIAHIAGALIIKSDKASRRTGDRAPPTKANFDTPSSMFVDFEGHCLYVCGGDEYDVRRVPTDMKTTTATLLQNGRWYVMKTHPNNNRGRPVFDPRKTGKPKTRGGRVTNLTVTPLVGIDREGNLYGKLTSWVGPTQYVKGKGYLSTRIFRIRRVK